MSLYEKLIAKEAVLAVVGLGYVGMPIAVAFAKKGLNVIGFDTNSKKIEAYRSGADPTKEVGDEQVRNTTVQFTDEEQQLRKADFIVVAVPTPVNFDHTPDLTPVIGASEIVGRNLKKGAIVVYESTVYPGCTENVCIPILEKGSGMVCGTDFKIGYSPERINPGDKAHRLENIRKIVSGMDEESLEEIQHIYDIVIEVGTYPVSNIRTAEAIKVVENSQRDINIAFMNELAMVFDRMDIDTNEVVDPWADREEAKRFYGVELVDLSDVREADCIIAAVAHEQFRALSVEELKALYRDVPDGQKVLIDVKGIYPVKDMKASGMRFWRL